MKWLGLVLVCLVLSGCGDGIFFVACSRNPGSSATRDQRAPDTFRVRFVTSKGDFVLEVTRSWAPLGADRFYTLVRSSFYDGARFFRVMPGFVVQFGIPANPALAKTWKNANLKDDPVTQSNRRGTVSYAPSGPDTRATQIFINLANNARLDRQGCAPFAAVTDGMEVVDQFYGGYGEGPPLGGGPAQTRIVAEGDAYIEREFPKLDFVKRATIQP